MYVNNSKTDVLDLLDEIENINIFRVFKWKAKVEEADSRIQALTPNRDYKKNLYFLNTLLFLLQFAPLDAACYYGIFESLFTFTVKKPFLYFFTRTVVVVPHPLFVISGMIIAVSITYAIISSFIRSIIISHMREIAESL